MIRVTINNNFRIEILVVNILEVFSQFLCTITITARPLVTLIDLIIDAAEGFFGALVCFLSRGVYVQLVFVCLIFGCADTWLIILVSMALQDLELLIVICHAFTSRYLLRSHFRKLVNRCHPLSKIVNIQLSYESTLAQINCIFKLFSHLFLLKLHHLPQAGSII